MSAPDIVQPDRHALAPELASFLAHELRTPLAVAVGSLPLLTTASPDVAARAASLIDRSLSTVQRMADDLSLIARVGRGEWLLHPAPVMLSTIIADIRQRTRDLGTERHLALAGTDVAWRAVDRQAIVRALTSLVEYLARETGTAHLSLMMTDAQAPSIVLHAHDQPWPRADATAAPLDAFASGVGFTLLAATALLHAHGLDTHTWSTNRSIVAISCTTPVR